MGKRIPPSRQREQVLFEGIVPSEDPLGEASRRRAQLTLEKASEMEAEDFLGRGHYERDREECLTALRFPFADDAQPGRDIGLTGEITGYSASSGLVGLSARPSAAGLRRPAEVALSRVPSVRRGSGQPPSSRRTPDREHAGR